MHTDSEIEELTEKIIGCAIEVHRILGPGLLESVYRECLVIELRRQRLHVDVERHVPLDYKGQRISGALKLDLLVERCVVVELKAVERLHPVYIAQVITYLKLTGYPAGLLMNFNSITLKSGLKRVNHPDRYVNLHKHETRVFNQTGDRGPTPQETGRVGGSLRSSEKE
jgi:GxxExxY protein